MEDKYQSLKLVNQLCFPLYAASKEVVRRYTPVLAALDLTYTQYIAMLVMWEHEVISAKKMGDLLYLDSGTLTPVLKCLEQKGYIERRRMMTDERVLECLLTEKGRALREKALCVPQQMAACARLTQQEAATLYELLYKVLGKE
jgi:DNA-binding MarR family transcriptional regulator